MSIAKNVKKFREKKGLHQRQLAEEMGVSHGLIAQIEQGLKIPSLAITMSLAKTLECTLDELVR